MKDILLNIIQSLHMHYVSSCMDMDHVFIEEKDLKSDQLASKKSQMDVLNKKYSNCLDCSLGYSRKNIVFGHGSLSPKVLFIGEGPGYDEDRKGLPFIGRSGQLLTKILMAIDLNREDVFITNIVKCHPMKDASVPDKKGNDRPPTVEESDHCWKILEQQIIILDPPIICTLGSVATKYLLKSDDLISHLRGNVFDFVIGKKIIPLIPTFHPSALLRNPKLKKDTWSDIQKIQRYIATQL